MEDLLEKAVAEVVRESAKGWFNKFWCGGVIGTTAESRMIIGQRIYDTREEAEQDGEELLAMLRALAVHTSIEYLGAFPEGERPS